MLTSQKVVVVAVVVVVVVVVIVRTYFNNCSVLRLKALGLEPFSCRSFTVECCLLGLILWRFGLGVVQGFGLVQ